MIECYSLKKNTVINKIVPDFMDTLYNCLHACAITIYNFLYINILSNQFN